MKKDKKDFCSKEENSLENIYPVKSQSNEAQLVVENTNDDNAVSIDHERVNVRKSGNLVVGNVNLLLNPLKRRNEEYYKKNIWHLVADAFLLILILALLIFLFSNDKIKKDIFLTAYSVNQEIYSGSLNSFELEYRLNASVDGSSVKVSLPEDFIIESVSPNNLFDSNLGIFNLGDLEAGTTGKIKINGFVWGNRNDSQMIAFVFDCEQCGRNGLANSLYYNIEKSALDIATQIDENIYLGSEFSGKLIVKNNSNSSFSDVQINLGPNIEILRSDLPIKDGEIILSKIDGRTDKEINFKALVEKEGEIEIAPKFAINFHNNIFSFFGEKFFYNVRKLNFNLNVSNDKKDINENEKIIYTFDYHNQEAKSIKNLKFSISSANPNFSLNSWSTLDNLKNSQHQDNSLIIYDLLEDESGTFSVETSFSRKQLLPNQEVSLRIDLEYEIDGQVAKYTLNSSKNKVISQVSTIAGAYYYSPQGDQLGVGPLPPAVDMATNYWVFLEFNNLGNNLENFVLTAELPENVYFSDNKRVLDGKLIYGEIGKRLVWEVPLITGGSNKYRANFEITLIPDEKDLGTMPNLLENIKFTVKDIFIDKEIAGSLENINTNLINDKLSSGKGKVINIR
ncbi:MAG: hypothetical protein WC928_02380 [Patescibacteria group bacterium]|jgi:hypothetical protein